MRKLFLVLTVAAAIAAARPAYAGELKFSMDGGLVTVIAKDVPLATILSEWARVGRTTVVNGDKVFTPVTLHLENVPERKALDILLRSVAGYMLAERQAAVAGGSAFDRIMILPTSRPPAGSAISQPPPAFNPGRPMPVQPQPVAVEDDDPGDPGQPPVPVQNVVPGAPGQPGGPQAPLTSPRPGQLPQPAPQQPVPFGAPRPGGGGAPGSPGSPGGPGGTGGPGGSGGSGFPSPS
jgi:hypothetical protein